MNSAMKVYVKICPTTGYLLGAHGADNYLSNTDTATQIRHTESYGSCDVTRFARATHCRQQLHTDIAHREAADIVAHLQIRCMNVSRTTSPFRTANSATNAS